jgi:acetoin utilization deacetylase AcuC-like enzyme
MDDPLSRIQLSDDFYPWIAGKMRDIAGPMVLILEGGYNLAALSRCNVKLINVLMDQVTNEYSKYEKDVYKRKMNVSNEISNETKRIFYRIQDMFSPFFEF